MIYQYPFRGLYKVSLPFGAPGKLWRCGYHSGLDLVSAAAGGDGRVYPVAPGKVIRRVVGTPRMETMSRCSTPTACSVSTPIWITSQ